MYKREKNKMTNLPQIKTSNRVSKRILDLSIIFPIFIVVLPLFFLLCIFYTITKIFLPKDRGSIIHKVFRKTKGRLFVIYKFKDELTSGLTGYYQLNKDYRALEDYNRFMLEGVDLDRKYHSELTRLNCLRVILLDLSIIFRTFVIIRRGEGI